MNGTESDVLPTKGAGTGTSRFEESYNKLHLLRAERVVLFWMSFLPIMPLSILGGESNIVRIS